MKTYNTYVEKVHIALKIIIYICAIHIHANTNMEINININANIERYRYIIIRNQVLINSSISDYLYTIGGGNFYNRISRDNQ